MTDLFAGKKKDEEVKVVAAAQQEEKKIRKITLDELGKSAIAFANELESKPNATRLAEIFNEYSLLIAKMTSTHPFIPDNTTTKRILAVCLVIQKSMGAVDLSTYDGNAAAFRRTKQQLDKLVTRLQKDIPRDAEIMVIKDATSRIEDFDEKELGAVQVCLFYTGDLGDYRTSQSQVLAKLATEVKAAKRSGDFSAETKLKEAAEKFGIDELMKILTKLFDPSLLHFSPDTLVKTTTILQSILYVATKEKSSWLANKMPIPTGSTTNLSHGNIQVRLETIETILKGVIKNLSGILDAQKRLSPSS